MTSDNLDKLFADKPDMLTVPEVAEILRLTKQATYKWVKTGKLPAYQVGATWFVLKDDLKQTLRDGASKKEGQAHEGN